VDLLIHAAAGPLAVAWALHIAQPRIDMPLRLLFWLVFMLWSTDRSAP